jgi:hypothetical protein
MDLEKINLIAKLLIFFSCLFSVVFTSGIVWRVEKKLDISYKLFLSAIIFFLSAEILGFFDFSSTSYFPLLISIARLSFSLLFLFGILEVRSLIRDEDGEKEN